MKTSTAVLRRSLVYLFKVQRHVCPAGYLLSLLPQLRFGVQDSDDAPSYDRQLLVLLLASTSSPATQSFLPHRPIGIIDDIISLGHYFSNNLSLPSSLGNPRFG
ncbi:hypothetical protein QCA50_013258 [Cerrena zonata]|uniref:Uncharacterized protein n=1 Tax=Cerrena zonata TaxID=2478898 RepID=A0AAW0G1K5_9APHY